MEEIEKKGAEMTDNRTPSREALYVETLARIAETDWHTRNVKPNPNGGIRGKAGMIAAYALTGKNGSYIGDKDTREAADNLIAALAARQTTPGAGEVERLRAALTHYGETFCEGFCDGDPSWAKFGDEHCSGCKAKQALFERSSPAEEMQLSADFVRALPGGVMDDSTFEQIEEALDRAEAPSVANGKWLSLVERIASLSKPQVPDVGVEELLKQHESRPHSLLVSLRRIKESGNPCGINVYPSEARRVLDVFDTLAILAAISAQSPAPADSGEEARELLAKAFEHSEIPNAASAVRRGHVPGFGTPLWMDEALSAISAALALRDAATARLREVEGAFLTLCEEVGVPATALAHVEYRSRRIAAESALEKAKGALTKIARRTSITFGRGTMSGNEAAEIATEALASLTAPASEGGE